MGNSSTVPAREGENLVDYLRRKFRSNSRKIDNLVAQELREEEAEEICREDPCQSESIRRIEAIGNGQLQPFARSGVPALSRDLVPYIQETELHPFAPSDVQPFARPGVPALPRTLARSRPHAEPSGHRQPPGQLPYRARVLLQEATPLGSRTYCQDVEIDDEFVQERIRYEETYVTRRNRGPTVIVGQAADTTGHHVARRKVATDTDLMPVSQVQDRDNYRSRLSRLRQMTLNLFRGRRAGNQPPTAIEDAGMGDFYDQPRVIELDDSKEEEAENREDIEDEKDEVLVSRPVTSASVGRASRLSLRDRARPVNTGGATMITEGCRTPRGAMRKKSGDAAVKKGPDRGIVWPKKMDELYSQTDKAYYIEQFQRTELFRQRTAKKDQGSETWMMALTPFQTWVIKNAGTAEMEAILKPKSKVRPNHTKAKVACWRDQAVPQRRHKMED